MNADALLRESLRFTGGLLDGVLRASWQACVLAVFVLLLQRALGARLSARARYNLWLLVVLRLVLPVTPQSRFSVFNLPAWAEARATAAIAGRAADPQAPVRPGPNPPRASAAPVGGAQLPTEGAPTPPPGRPSPADIAEADAELATAEAGNDAIGTGADDAGEAATASPIVTTPSAPAQLSPAAMVPVARSWRDTITPANIWAAAALFWLAGVVVATWRIVRATRAFGATVRRMRPVNDPIVLAIADGCRRDLGLARPPAMLEGPQVQSPALGGWRRPVLLLPDGITRRLDSRELRLVLLHELAHCERHDVAANWLLVAVAAAHWFNPLVRLLMRRVRADRELACDEAVLAAAGGQ